MRNNRFLIILIIFSAHILFAQSSDNLPCKTRDAIILEASKVVNAYGDLQTACRKVNQARPEVEKTKIFLATAKISGVPYKDFVIREATNLKDKRFQLVNRHATSFKSFSEGYWVDIYFTSIDEFKSAKGASMIRHAIVYINKSSIAQITEIKTEDKDIPVLPKCIDPPIPPTPPVQPPKPPVQPPPPPPPAKENCCTELKQTQSYARGVKRDLDATLIKMNKYFELSKKYQSDMNSLNDQLLLKEGTIGSTKIELNKQKTLSEKWKTSYETSDSLKRIYSYKFDSTITRLTDANRRIADADKTIEENEGKIKELGAEKENIKKLNKKLNDDKLLLQIKIDYLTRIYKNYYYKRLSTIYFGVDYKIPLPYETNYKDTLVHTNPFSRLGASIYGIPVGRHRLGLSVSNFYQTNLEIPAENKRMTLDDIIKIHDDLRKINTRIAPLNLKSAQTNYTQLRMDISYLLYSKKLRGTMTEGEFKDFPLMVYIDFINNIKFGQTWNEYSGDLADKVIKHNDTYIVDFNPKYRDWKPGLGISLVERFVYGKIGYDFGVKQAYLQAGLNIPLNKAWFGRKKVDERGRNKLEVKINKEIDKGVSKNVHN